MLRFLISVLFSLAAVPALAQTSYPPAPATITAGNDGILVGGSGSTWTISNAKPYSAAQALSDLSASFATPASVTSAISAATSSLQTATQVTDAIAANAAASSTYAGGCNRTAPCTFAALKSAAPCDAARSGFYGVITDFGSADGVNTNVAMRCTLTQGFGYRWTPTSGVQNVAVEKIANGTPISFGCVVNAPLQLITGSPLVGGTTVNMSGTDCWPGATVDVANDSLLGVLNVGNLVGGIVKAIGVGGRQRFVYTVNGWKAF